MQLTCPCCHTRYPLDAANQDEAARDLLAFRGSLPPRIWPVLIAYLGLFRSETRALAWDRALRLAKEVQELNADPGHLENALAETVEALRAKQGPPLKNHNYLRRVLENTAGTVARAPMQTEQSAPRSKAGQAITALDAWAGGDWLLRGIAAGLCACVAQSLKFTPAAEMITLNADTWHLALKQKLTIEEIDAPRLAEGFQLLLPKLTEWPQPKQLVELIPNRPQRAAIRHDPTDADRAKGREVLRNIQDLK